MYSELYAAWQREIENPALQQLPADFYTRLSDYLKRIKEETRVVDQKTLKDFLLERETRNVNRMVNDLLMARYKKLIRTIGETQKMPSDLLTNEEVKLCEGFLPFAMAYREFARNLLQGQAASVKIEQIVQPHSRVAVRFLKAIPAIIGSDMKTYGPFLAEDVASIPAENAKILMKQGLAVVVEVSN
jgi:DNA replication factor GINS